MLTSHTRGLYPHKVHFRATVDVSTLQFHIFHCACAKLSYFRFRFSFTELVARRLAIKKAKQTIIHNGTTKQYNTRQEMKCNVMKKTHTQLTKKSDIGLLIFYEGVMNERFVAVSTVTRSRIRGCFSKPRCDLSVTRGRQQVMNAIRWIKQFAEEITAKFIAPI